MRKGEAWIPTIKEKRQLDKRYKKVMKKAGYILKPVLRRAYERGLKEGA